MSDFTIEQLESLKGGTRHAPWKHEYDEGEDHWVIAFDHPKYGSRWDKGIAHGEGAAKLFAAAPALVEALIAEKRAHQALRNELAYWKKAAEDSAMRASSIGDSERAFNQNGVVDILTYLLEGE